MAAQDRLKFFPFYADAWLEDPAVIAMSAEAEGCYIRLLARSWKSKTPGIIQAGLVPEMAGLHRVKESERERVLKEIEGAFSLSDNAWVQRRMVAEWRHANEVYKARVGGATKTNAAKDVARSPSRSPSRSPGVDLDLEVDLEEKEEPKDLLTGVSGNGNGLSHNGHHHDKSWAEMFDWFWDSFPRKVGKPAAKRSWAGIRPQTQESIDAINEGLSRWEGVWASKGKEFIPYPATFLNQRRWEDIP